MCALILHVLNEFSGSWPNLTIVQVRPGIPSGWGWECVQHRGPQEIYGNAGDHIATCYLPPCCQNQNPACNSSLESSFCAHTLKNIGSTWFNCRHGWLSLARSAHLMPEVSDSGAWLSFDIDLGHFVAFYTRSPRWWFNARILLTRKQLPSKSNFVEVSTFFKTGNTTNSPKILRSVRHPQHLGKHDRDVGVPWCKRYLGPSCDDFKGTSRKWNGGYLRKSSTFNNA